MPTLTWEELAGDLRLARHFCDQILIHSLEGCVWQGFLPRLRSFEWADVEGPPDGVRAAAALRTSLRATLWASSHPAPVLGSPRPPPGSPGAGAADDVLQHDRTLPYWRASKAPAPPWHPAIS
jgi:hypothetical protein